MCTRMCVCVKKPIQLINSYDNANIIQCKGIFFSSSFLSFFSPIQFHIYENCCYVHFYREQGVRAHITSFNIYTDDSIEKCSGTSFLPSHVYFCVYFKISYEILANVVLIDAHGIVIYLYVRI